MQLERLNQRQQLIKAAMGQVQAEHQAKDALASTTQRVKEADVKVSQLMERAQQLEQQAAKSSGQAHAAKALAEQ